MARLVLTASDVKALLTLLLCLASLLVGVGARAQERCVDVAELDGIINAGTADYVAEAVDHAQRSRCDALVLKVDSPGGTLGATRDIVKELLSATVPTIVFVAPAGARAGSGAMFVTLAAHVAAMAPGTTLGAAHPVLMTGRDPDGQAAEEMAKKVENDTAALARAIAEERGRDVPWAEQAVRESSSLTAREALEKGVIDDSATSTQDLLNQVSGRELTVGGEAHVLDTRGATLRPIEMTVQQSVVAVLGNPNVAYALFMLGVLGIMIELYNPGLFVPAGVGVLALILAATGMSVLPVDVGALLLLCAALMLFVAEAWVTSYGLLTVAGVAVLLLASALWIEEPSPDLLTDASTGLSWMTVLPSTLVLTVAAALLARAALRGQRAPITTGRAALETSRGVALEDVTRSSGEVRVQGARWRATSDEPISRGEPVQVVRVEGLTLVVRKMQDTALEARSAARHA